MATWELFRDGDNLTLGPKVEDLIDIRYIDSANPFGDKLIAQIEDTKGQKFEQFDFGTRVDLSVTPDGGTDSIKFVGYVVERRENDQNGQDVLEIVAYTFDQFLRRNDVSNDQSGKLISEAIVDIVDTDTPILVNSNTVNVVDDVQLRRSFQDQRIETALQTLSFQSANESFGVTQDGIFRFEPRETDKVQRGIDNTQWFNYDIPERGKDALNEVEVRFAGGDRSVVVDNPQQKLVLEDGVDLPNTPTQRARINRPNITNIQDAELEGRQFLKLKNVTLTGTVTTFGLFDAEPGDTIQIEITSRGIDSEFIISKIEYNWSADETTLTIIENRGFDDDLIVRLEEKTERIDLRDTDPDAVQSKIVSTQVAAKINASLSGFFSTGTLTNTGADRLADGWAGGRQIVQPNLVLGDNDTAPSRSDDRIFGRFKTVPRQSFNKNNKQAIFFSEKFTANGISELGVEDSNGNLLCRSVPDNAPISFNDERAVFSFDISDATESNGVVTDTGLNIIRDLIAADFPDLSNQYAFGDDRTEPTTSDTTLTNQVQFTNLNQTELQSIDSASEFQNNISTAEDSPVEVVEQIQGAGVGAITLNEVSYVSEAEKVENFQGNLFSDSNLSNDTGVDVLPGDFVEFEFTVNQDIQAGDLRLGTYARLEFWDGIMSYSLDGVEYRSVQRGTGDDSFSNSLEGFSGEIVNRELQAGTTHTLRAECIEANAGNHIIDAIFAYDDRSRFNITTPNSSTSSNPDPAFNGDTYKYPELYPAGASVNISTVETLRKLTEIRLTQNWNDTSNNALVQLAIGSDSTTVFNPVTNANDRITETHSVSSSDAARSARVSLNLSRFDDPGNNDFPTEGDAAQEVSFHVLSGNPSAINRSGIGEVTLRTSFENGLLAGETLREGGQLATGDLLTHSIFTDVNPENDTILPVEKLRFIPK